MGDKTTTRVKYTTHTISFGNNKVTFNVNIRENLPRVKPIGFIIRKDKK